MRLSLRVSKFMIWENASRLKTSWSCYVVYTKLVVVGRGINLLFCLAHSSLCVEYLLAAACNR